MAGLGSLLPAPSFGYTQHNVSRCPGAATEVAADGSNEFTPPASIPCNQSQRP